MKRYIAIAVTAFFSLTFAFAQDAATPAQQAPADNGATSMQAPANAADIGSPDPTRVQGATPSEALQEISVDKFEQEGSWLVTIPSDSGYAAGRLFVGGPASKQPIQDEKQLNIPDKNVFGARIDFLRRGYTNIYVTAIRPIPIDGITKTVSVWVAGRNYNHTLYLVLQDALGRQYEILMGKLNFQGWKQMMCNIPPQTANPNSIVQTDYHSNDYSGIKVVGFRIAVDPQQAYGTYYAYFDDLRAVTDLFAESDRDPDDPSDAW
jgi:hypothetical protein